MPSLTTEALNAHYEASSSSGKYAGALEVFRSLPIGELERVEALSDYERRFELGYHTEEFNRAWHDFMRNRNVPATGLSTAAATNVSSDADSTDIEDAILPPAETDAVMDEQGSAIPPTPTVQKRRRSTSPTANVKRRKAEKGKKSKETESEGGEGEGEDEDGIPGKSTKRRNAGRGMKNKPMVIESDHESDDDYDDGATPRARGKRGKAGRGRKQGMVVDTEGDDEVGTSSPTKVTRGKVARTKKRAQGADGDKTVTKKANPGVLDNDPSRYDVDPRAIYPPEDYPNLRMTYPTMWCAFLKVEEAEAKCPECAAMGHVCYPDKCDMGPCLWCRTRCIPCPFFFKNPHAVEFVKDVRMERIMRDMQQRIMGMRSLLDKVREKRTK